MRLIFGVLGMSLVMIVIFMAQSGQLAALKKIPEVSKMLGGSGQGDKDFSLSAATPQKILESFKKTMNSVAQRNQALLEGDAPSTAPLDTPATESSPAVAETPKVHSDVVGSSTNPMSKYGMSLVRLTDAEAQPYLGNWRSTESEAQIQMRLQRDRSISSLRITAEPNTHISFGHNQLPLWKNTANGLIIFALSDDEYLHLSGKDAELTGFLYQRERRGDRSRIPEAKAFRRTLRFTLRR